jgi:hypothetical protein
VAAGEAAAKSFSLPQASVAIAVEPDGSLSVEEHITFAFDGSFSGAYRDIPLRQGEVIQDVFVAEGANRYSPGASAELGSFGVPGTFGTTRIDGGLRIVWHYSALSEVRTFTVGYRLVGVAVAYDDVVDVNLKVWGDQWEQSLGQLTATLLLPTSATGNSYRVWGHPVSVRGDVTRGARQVDLRAVRVPSHQFVERPRRLSALRPLLDRRDTGTSRGSAGPHRRGGACGRRLLRARPGADPERPAAPSADDPRPPGRRPSPGARSRRSRLLVLRTGAPDRL